MSQPGSFEWYQELKDPFFKHITKAIASADVENKYKLENVFQHISRAHREYSWEVCPNTTRKIVTNIENKNIPDLMNIDYSKSKEGSMNWYLFRSGNFLTNLSHALVYADTDNMSRIEKEYPQLHAACMCEWNEPPEGFEENHYQSKMKT